MNCLSLDRLYRYLDRDLSPEEAAEVELHLAGCPRCREAVELRRALSQAASSLPDLELPAGFAEAVLGRITRSELPHKSWLAILGVGLGTLGVGLGTLILASGQSATGLLVGSGRGALDVLGTAFVFLLKFFKLVQLAGKILPELGASALRGLTQISASVPLAIVALSGVVALIFVSTCLVGFRRKLVVEDDIGEDP